MFVYGDPSLLQVQIKVCAFTREIIALKAKINSFSFIAGGDPAVRILAVSVPAPPTVCLRELPEQFLERDSS